jgi:glycosyltransferase involved in cell wall biosynthesis
MLREVCCQLYGRGWYPVLWFEGQPAPEVLEYLRSTCSLDYAVIPSQAGLRLNSVKQYWRQLSRDNPDLVVYAFNGIIRFLPWVCRLKRVKRVVYWDHSSRAIGYTPRALPTWKRLLLRPLTLPVDHVTAVAGYTGRCLTAEGLYPTGPITVVHNGVEICPTPPERGREFRKQFGIPADVPLLVQVCWLTAPKGVDMLLRVTRRVVDSKPDVRLAIIGEGSNRPEYEALTKSLGLQNNVTFTGSISQPRTAGVFRAADVYCQFSQWEEACPLAVQEAMADGCAIVASRVGGIPELVEDGVSGLLCGRQDIELAIAHILSLLEDADLRRRVGAKASEHARSNFDLVANCSRLLDSWGLDSTNGAGQLSGGTFRRQSAGHDAS